MTEQATRRERNRVLWLTTGAFFLTFVVWFNMAPFNIVLKQTFELTAAQLSILMTANVALTIPARIFIGRLVDRYGPRIVYSGLLVVMSIPCMVLALSTEYWQLLTLRLMLSGIGAGFVVGIRMVSEWFPPGKVGVAEGLYGGFGNFGSAAAAMSLPLIAMAFPAVVGWRWAVAFSGLLCLIYGVIYYRSVQDTPQGVAFEQARRKGAMEVTSKGDLLYLLALNIPTYGVLGLFTWRIAAAGIISPAVAYLISAGLTLTYFTTARKAYTVNKPHLDTGVPQPERYSFHQVAVLCLAYAVCFGGELTVVSMLPQFFAEHYGMGLAAAGMIGSSFAFTNLFARSGGGWLADRLGGRRMLILVLGGLGLGFSILGLALESNWLLLPGAVVMIFLTSLFVQASEGVAFAIVPLVRRPLTGQIAGLVGAYGNVGAVIWLLVLQQFGPAGLFLSLGAAGIITSLLSTTLVLRPVQAPAVSSAAAALETNA